MALPTLVTDDHIKKLEQKENDALNRMYAQFEKSKLESWERKERWLAIYARCLSPSVACRQTEISIDNYNKWRKTDPRFCRGLNKCIKMAEEELMGSVLGRATGYTKPCDPEAPTDSGLEEDGSGKVIHYGASDTLAKAWLGLDKPEQKQGSGGVVVEINVAALLGKTSIAVAPVAGDQESSAVRVSDDSVVNEQ